MHRSLRRPSRRDLLSYGAALGSAALAAGCGATPPAASPASPPPAPAPPAPKRILVLGGTGFLGPAFVEAARARGHQLTLFHRGKTRPQLFPEVEKILGDRNESLDALHGRTWDAVLDTSGYLPKQVARAAEALRGAGQYIFISSVSVYDKPNPAGSDETAKRHVLKDPAADKVTPETYGALKAACEDEAQKAFGERAALVRPGLIVGPEDPTDRFTYWPVRLARGGEIVAPGTGRDPAQIIDVRDLGAWLVLLVEGRLGGAYNAVGPDAPMTMASMLEAVGRGVGSTGELRWLPEAFLEEQKVSPWMDMPVWVPATDPDDGGMAKVRRDRAAATGLTHRPVDVTARDTLAWWKTLPEARTAKMRAGLAAEREAAVLEAWKKRPKG